ncbi:MAG TPA: HAD domain-containing protein [Solirubrobacteraceae bacterium]|nr:HAD domain-containing protein [Solirubrobacteraceae bacterium]
MINPPPAGDLHASNKPLLLIDIDGVISLFGFDPHALPRGEFHSIDGIPHFLSAGAAEHLLALADVFQLVWASGWEEKADEYLPHLLGFPRGLPFLSFERSPGRSNAHWKLDAIDAYAGSQPLAWVDDAFNSACHEWAEQRRAPTLLVSTEPQQGLTAGAAATLRAWAHAAQTG